MKQIIIANWKMNPATQKEAKQLFDGVKKGIKNTKIDVVICPPFVYLEEISGLTLGAQDVFYKEKGAFTGEISPQMLKDLRVEYVIVGHSERRRYFGETDETINKKIKAVLDSKLKPIFCVGENEGEDKQTVVERQIAEGLKDISRDSLKNIIVAYEPVWAISSSPTNFESRQGRGDMSSKLNSKLVGDKVKNCSIDETMKSILLIRKTLSNLFSRQLADKMPILYGGSVTSKNSAQYLKDAGVDGLLVGGASLDAVEFSEIVKSAD